MWKRATNVPSTAAPSSWRSGVIFTCRHEAILPSILSAATLEPPRKRLHSLPQYQNITQDRKVGHRHHSSDSRCSDHGHRRYLHRFPQWPCSQFNFQIATVYSQNNLQQRRKFQATFSLLDSSNKKARKNLKKGQKQNPILTKQKRTRPLPAHKMAAGVGMTLEECSNYLIQECTEIRTIELNKRQRLKPWIMALLVHRYDRGIREIDELNTDSVYYNGGRSSNQNNTTTNVTHVSYPIDLRKVLTPEPIEIDGYIAARQSQNDSSENSKSASRKTPQDRNKIREILRHEKLALLATEARRVLIDREIPFSDLAALSNEAGVRKLSKQDPSVFLSLFSRAFCVSGKGAKQKQSTHSDFSHRRFHPPSLKAASHKKKKLKEKKDRQRLAAEKNNSKTESFHRNSPRALQQKLRAMKQRNQ